MKSYGELPSAFMSFAPIIVPILLMALSSAMNMAGNKIPIVTFLGTPIIAISVGVLLGILLFASRPMEDKAKAFYELTNETLKVCGPILFITAAGGVLGKVIASTNMVAFIKPIRRRLLVLVFSFLSFSQLSSRRHRVFYRGHYNDSRHHGASYDDLGLALLSLQR